MPLRLSRTSRALLLALAAIALTALFYFASPPPEVRHRLSMGTAYSSLIFLAASLSMGPWRILGHRHSPVSYNLRRDVGITGGLLALLHTGVGLTVHLRGRMWMYFLRRLHPLQLQANAFGAANYIGAVAAVLFIMLVAISNDVSLRRLGTARWKSLQRYTYAAFALTAAHAILFQTVEKRKLAWVVVFAACVTFTLILQLLGFRARQAERSR